MNNSYEIDMCTDNDTKYDLDVIMDNYRKRKYSELESNLRKKITYKRVKYNVKYTFYKLPENYGIV